MGILGFYAVLILIATSGGKKEKEAAPVAPLEVSHSTIGSDEIPAADSSEFGDWLAVEGNFEKLLTGAAAH